MSIRSIRCVMAVVLFWGGIGSGLWAQFEATDGAAAPTPAEEEVMNRIMMSLQRSRPPLLDIAHRMGDVASDLAADDTTIRVQQKEDDIIARIDKLIEQLQQTCPKCGAGAAGGSAQPTRPLPASRIVGGPGGMGELIRPKSGGRSWGELPPRQREKILQSRKEGFPPEYENIIESYFRNLAEETETPDSE